jgi:lipid II:glycine glycyltransferase (peptidoglycan interpeptide bridge formation enzyme)
MKVHLRSKKLCELHPTDILFQTEYWGKVKTRLGWKPYAFDISTLLPGEDVLVLIKSFHGNSSVAYVPQGPELTPDEGSQGVFLEALSEALSGKLDSKIAFIRYDLPWTSPYAQMMNEKQWYDFPESRVREMRMNFATKNWNLKKAPVDMTITDNFIVRIGGSEEEILSRMKPKTRYNINLARRKGVQISMAPAEKLPIFYQLYRETALRHGFPISEFRYFSALFSAQEKERSDFEIVLLLATHNQDVLAGAIIAISKTRAIFLHGASSNEKRNFMGSYALHWEAIRYARCRSCRTYDMGAVSPSKDPGHSFFGLYRFKSGFGGDILHRSGSWDYPIDQEAYITFRNLETLQRGKRF